MRAKFKCQTVTTNELQNERAKLMAVRPGNPEDDSFATATPAGDLEIYINNPASYGYFKPGKSYYLDFTEAE